MFIRGLFRGSTHTRSAVLPNSPLWPCGPKRRRHRPTCPGSSAAARPLPERKTRATAPGPCLPRLRTQPEKLERNYGQLSWWDVSRQNPFCPHTKWSVIETSLGRRSWSWKHCGASRCFVGQTAARRRRSRDKSFYDVVVMDWSGDSTFLTSSTDFRSAWNFSTFIAHCNSCKNKRSDQMKLCER